MNRLAKCAFLPVVILLAAVPIACNKSQDQAADFTNGNPADGNLAPVNPTEQNYYTPVTSQYEQPVETTEPPPPLPEYNQPPCPGENYAWTPGYWNYASNGYYWVPGAWVLAPWVGALWTPPWWDYDNGVYIWHTGYWAPHVGFYGGINYGFGYTGRGYYGAYWKGGRLIYNRAVTDVDPARVHSVYNYTPPRNSSRNNDRVSFNGPRGVSARPTPQELAVGRDPRTAAVPAQIEHARQASSSRAQFAGARGGRPDTLVASRPLSTEYHAPAPHPPAKAMRAAARPTPAPRTAFQANEHPERQAAPVTPENGFTARQVQRPYAPSRPATGPVPAQPHSPEAAVRPGQQRPITRQQEINRAVPGAPAFAPQFRREQPVARAAQAPRAEPPRPEQARPEQRVALPPPRELPRPVQQPRSQPQARVARPEPQARPQVQPRPPAQAQPPAPRPQRVARPQPQGRAASPRPQPEEERRQR